ncbi:MAG: hypothetical protein JSV91_08620 [Phycisphaerales bacterium]|nr:MAG: hypothetical protein JSV91_08620 [Phycisphaerales bacterium]
MIHDRPDFTKLHMDVAFGRAGGRIIWQPRILAWFADKEFAGEPLPAPYTGMTPAEVYRALGCSNRIYEFDRCFVSHEDERVRITQQDISETDYEIVWETPIGRQRAVYRRSPNTWHHAPVKWPISDSRDLKVAAWREHRRTWSWDQDAFDRLSREWAGLGAPTMCICRTNVQKLFIEDMGAEAGIFALHDDPGGCEQYFEALATTQERLIEVINDSEVMLINFGDNVHSGLLPPKWFEKYVLPVYQRRCDLLHAAGKFVAAHWDGDCKPLLPYLKETGLDGIEAITPKPQGDVTLREVKDALGDMVLLDGIPAVYFDHTFSEQNLIDSALECIDLFAPNLLLGISDEISSHGDIERIRIVGEIVDQYNTAIAGSA